MIELPGAFRQTTVEREAERGAAWLAQLPLIVDEMLTRWVCAPDGPVLHGGVGVVIPVRAEASGPGVLKVSFPHPGNVHEPERAQMSTLLEVESADDAAEIAGAISRRLAIKAPAGLPRLSERADEWERQLLEDAAELDHPLSASALGTALATVCELGRLQPELMVHGDFHASNILRAEREPWLVVDPKGYAGDPAYDATMPIKWPPLMLLKGDDLRKAVRGGLEIFADAAELDRERVRRWGQFHAVQVAFWGRRHGAQRDTVTEFAGHLAEVLADEPHR